MIIYDVEQGTTEWQTVRLGIPTASRFKDILTPAKLELSKQADGYINELLAEYVIGEPMDMPKTPYMDRGTELEEAAADWYEFEVDTDTEQIGFVADDQHRWGCSPDRWLVGVNGGVEIKCPGGKNHIAYLRDIDALIKEYRLQLQGNIWICEREWWDIVVYNPSQYIPNIRHRVQRDETVIIKLRTALREFSEKLEAAKAELPSLDCDPWCLSDDYKAIINNTQRKRVAA